MKKDLIVKLRSAFEQLPPAKDLKKIECWHSAEAKSLPKTVDRLDDESTHE